MFKIAVMLKRKILLFNACSQIVLVFFDAFNIHDKILITFPLNNNNKSRKLIIIQKIVNISPF